MKFSISPSEVLIVAVLVGGIGAAAWRYFGDDDSGGARALTVQVPTLSFQAADGAVAFDAHCVACHGKSGSGTNQGPPLVHDIYNPGHHADESFWRAVRQGVQQHHWRFGHMAPLPQVSDPQLTAISALCARIAAGQWHRLQAAPDVTGVERRAALNITPGVVMRAVVVGALPPEHNSRHWQGVCLLSQRPGDLGGGPEEPDADRHDQVAGGCGASDGGDAAINQTSARPA